MRRCPTYLHDCFVGDDLDLDSDDDDVNIADLINQDPIYYEDAIKEDKWKKAMDLEIQAIERNQT